jgi:hypothetical protein
LKLLLDLPDLRQDGIDGALPARRPPGDGSAGNVR